MKMGGVRSKITFKQVRKDCLSILNINSSLISGILGTLEDIITYCEEVIESARTLPDQNKAQELLGYINPLNVYIKNLKIQLRQTFQGNANIDAEKQASLIENQVRYRYNDVINAITNLQEQLGTMNTNGI